MAVDNIRNIRPSEPVYQVPEVKGDFLVAPALEDIAASLISEYPELNELNGWAIGYYWKKKGGKTRRRERFGNAQVTSGLLRHSTQKTFIVWLAADHIERAEYTARQIEAELYRQLLTCKIDEARGTPIIEGPEFAVTAYEVQNFGAWNKNIEALGWHLQQLDMTFGDPGVEEPEDEDGEDGEPGAAEGEGDGGD